MGYFYGYEEENKGMTTEEEDSKDTINAGNEAPNAEYNVYGSKLEDVREINRLKDENLTLKLIIGDMQLKIFELSNRLHISKEKK